MDATAYFLCRKMNTQREIKKKNRKSGLLILAMLAAVFIMAAVCMFVGSSSMTFSEALKALMYNGTPAHERIIWNIRIPRVLAAIIAGAGLSVSGLIMQTTLNNSMASPSTLGVSNAAVFGANLSIIAFAGGFPSVGGNVNNFSVGANPYSTSLMAFIFSTASILLILGLCKIRAFSPGVVVLAGIAVGSVWTAATTILQFYATDVGLSAAVVWSFGDLGRATYKTDAIMFAVVLLGTIFFQIMSWRFNALLSLMTGAAVSFTGIIGFVGIICPHVTKRLLGQDHRFAIPMSALSGSLLLLMADTLSRSIGNGSALPVGAITSLLGAPFFIAIIFSRKENRRC